MNTVIDRSKKLFIIGAGGLGKEVFCTVMELWKWPALNNELFFLEEDLFYNSRKVLGIEVLPLSETDTSDANVVIAIGDSKARKRIASLLPSDTMYATIIHPTVSLTPYTNIGSGGIVLAHCFLSCDVEIGSHAVINPSTTISHDCVIGEFLTCSPGVNISGNCTLGSGVFLGANACIRNAVKICDEVTVGIGSVVIKDLNASDTYIGNPARSINQVDKIK